MHKKSEESKSKTCVVKRCLTYLAKPSAYIFEVMWAIGASVVATMVSPLPIHQKGLRIAAPFDYFESDSLLSPETISAPHSNTPQKNPFPLVH